MIFRLSVLLLMLMAATTAMALEEPEYEVLAEAAGYEIRRYEPYVVAEVDASGQSAGNDGFRVLAGYIFGDNGASEKMQMTAPVESRAAEAGNKTTYSFVMERRFTLETLPEPNSDRIRLRERPARIVAVRRFSGRWSDANVTKNEERLLDDLANDGVQLAGAFELARYNSPFTPWFLRRNEVMVPVSWPATTP